MLKYIVLTVFLLVVVTNAEEINSNDGKDNDKEELNKIMLNLFSDDDDEYDEQMEGPDIDDEEEDDDDAEDTSIHIADPKARLIPGNKWNRCWSCRRRCLFGYKKNNNYCRTCICKRISWRWTGK